MMNKITYFLNHKYQIISALILTFLFYRTTMHGLHGIPLYGDNADATYPSFRAVLYYVKNFYFYGYDQFTHGGGSEYFLRPNFPSYNIIFIFAGILHSVFSSIDPMDLYMGSLFLSTFLGFYFAQLLGLKLWLSKELALVFATIFILFPLTISYLGIMHFYMISVLLPMLIYLNLQLLYSSSFKKILCAITMNVSYLFLGYVPLQLAGFAISLLFVLMYAYSYDLLKYEQIKRLAIVSLVTLIVISPTYFAYKGFNLLVDTTSISSVSQVAWVGAYNFSDLFGFTLGKAGSEGGLVSFGLLPILIIVYTFLNNIFGKEKILLTKFSRLSLIVYGIYFLTLFGQQSIMSEVMYYLVPVFGKMHYYARYILLFHIFLAVVVVFSVKEIVTKNDIFNKLFIGLLISIVLFIAFFIKIDPGLAAVRFNITEIKLGFLILAVVVFYGFIQFSKESSKYYLFEFALIFISLNFMYTNVNALNTAYDSHKKIIFENELNTLIDFMKKPNNQLVKYINFDKNTHPYVSHNLPWVVADNIKLLSPHGYELHLARDSEYAKMVPYYGTQNISAALIFNFKPDYIIISKDELDSLKFLIPYIDFQQKLLLSNGQTVFATTFNKMAEMKTLKMVPDKRIVANSMQPVYIKGFSNKNLDSSIIYHQSPLNYIFPENYFDGWSKSKTSNNLLNSQNEPTNFFIHEVPQSIDNGLVMKADEVFSLPAEEIFKVDGFTNEKINGKFLVHNHFPLNTQFPKNMFDGWTISRTGVLFDSKNNQTNFHLVDIDTKMKKYYDGIIQIYGQGDISTLNIIQSKIGQVELDIEVFDNVVIEYLPWIGPSLRFEVDGKEVIPEVANMHSILKVNSGNHHIKITYRNIMLFIGLNLLLMLFTVNVFVFLINPLFQILRKYARIKK
ncbi:MAG: hypothetical protein EOM50_06525 [Erysipelotrichia bacterium]|nr:hypothetical protein [Erysipelotrichia bacterium]